MTTKFKIILGFTLMVLLIGAMAVLGYRGLEESSDGFVEYRRQARLNVAISDMGTSLIMAVAKTFDYADARDPKLLEDGLAATNAFEKLAVDAETESRKATTKERFGKLLQDEKQLQSMMTATGTNLTGLRDIYFGPVAKHMVALLDQLSAVSKTSRELDNIDSLYFASEAGIEYALALSALSRFSESRSEEDAKIVGERLKTAEQALNRLGGALVTERGKRDFAGLAEAHKGVLNGFEQMLPLAGAARDNFNKMRILANNMVKILLELNTEVDQDMRDYGALQLTQNEEDQRTMLIISVVGVLIGIALAAFIIIGIVRVLNELARFAGAVAAGNFSHQIKTRERGEIGAMVTAMKQIPAVLQNIIDTANNLAKAITVGKLRERLNTSEFSGSYGDLATAVNTVGNAYTSILDALPIPVMAADKTYTVTFYNKAGQDTVGGNLVDTPCKNNFGAPECGAGGCFGKHAMEQGKIYVNETSIGEGNARKDLSVTAVPLRDMNGASAGFIEILTDLTEIRSQQRTMLSVAQQASEISNRVAAASEELSSQVEQISRGAELQRSRVESTASAMTEMNATVLEVARSAGQASEQSDGTRKKAEEGAGLVHQVTAAINAVNAVGQNLQVNMEELGKQAENIGGIMNAISDIADQTNLLALNAAIEAARAGEAGRGFAVVADEVRKLAEKTMEATREVGASITAVQNSARINIEEVGKAVSSVAEATGLANSSGEALSEIVDLAAANSSVVASIATAAEEQSATSEEINRAIDEINQVVGETTEGMLQSSAAVQELSHMAQELRRVMEGLR